MTLLRHGSALAALGSIALGCGGSGAAATANGGSSTGAVSAGGAGGLVASGGASAGGAGGLVASGGASAGGAGAGSSAGGVTTGGEIELAPSSPVSFTETSGAIQNPERGFYRYVNVIGARNLESVYADGYSLVFSYVRLDDYREAPLPQSLLDGLSAGLAAVRDAGLGLVLRFAYNAGPWPDSEPDAPKDRVLAHLEQLAPLLRANEDVITVLQAGFIGAWGEWHTSTAGLLDDPQDREDVLLALLDALPPSRSTQLRYPPHKAGMFGAEPLAAETAFSGEAIARTGHHNDCFLSSDTDVGTYPSDQVEQWKQYLEQDTRFVPMGGETCSLHERGLCPTAMAEMARLHFSYLNRDYDTAVIDRWVADGCYDEIARSLGYRLVLRQATLPAAVRPGGRFRLALTLENLGWAAPFNPRPVELRLDGASGSHRVTVAGLDPRRWLPGDTLEVPLLVQLPSALPTGEYELSIALPSASPSIADRAEYAIRFANEDTWQNGRNRLGWFVVDPAAAGGAGVDAPELAVQLEGP